jgi:carboxypeptidase Taq
MQAKLTELKQRLREVTDLQHVGALLHWDQATYMPPGGAAARGRQIAIVSQLAHENLSMPLSANCSTTCSPGRKQLPTIPTRRVSSA